MIEVGSRVGSYEIARELTRGGMATLFLGRRSGPAGFSRHVAIKVIKKELAADEHFREMFLDEARLSARIHHPNVVHVEELGEHEGELYLVMEYIDGVTVADILRGMARRHRYVPIHLGVALAAHVADGLHAAHEAKDEHGQLLNLVHRDVSPQNVLIGSRGHVKVIDFGVAKARGRLTQTEAGELKGKLAYMTPEQVKGRGIDRRTDVFSLGIVLWEMLTLRRLFYCEREAEILERIREAKVAPPSSHRGELHPDLDHVILTALAGEPENRFQTAWALRRALLSVSPQAALVEPGELANLVAEVASGELDRRRSVIVALDDETTETTVVAPMASEVLFSHPTGQREVTPGDALIEACDDNVHAARRAGETLPLARALTTLIAALLDAGELTRADAALAECASLVRRAGPGVRGHVSALQGRLARATGELGERRVAEERAYRLYKDAAWSRRSVHAGLSLADTYRMLGALRDAETILREVLAAGIELGMNQSIGDAWIGLGRTFAAAESWADAELALGEALLRAEQGGEPEQEASARAHRAAVFVGCRRFSDGRAEAEEALRLVDAHELARDPSGGGADPRIADWANAALGREALGSGDQPRAEAHSGAAVAWFGLRDHLEDGDASMLLLRADVLESGGHVESAQAVRRAAAERIEASARRLGEGGDWAERFRTEVPDHRALLGAS